MSGIQYCTTDDGIRIAYALRGSGAPLIMCPFFVEGFANADELPEYREFVEALGRGRTLIQFDMRGTGMSQRDVLDLSLGALMLDIRAVARAARSRRS